MADARFCSACGGALHLAPCPRCGAVSDVKAITCYQCHARLPGRGTDMDAPDFALFDKPDPAPPAAEVSRPFFRPSSRWVAGSAVFAAIGVLGYFGYGQRSFDNSPRPVAAGSEASVPGGTPGTGMVRRDVAADPAPVHAAGGATASPSDPLPEVPSAVPARTAGDPSRAGRQAVESREARTAIAPTAQTSATDAVRGGKVKPFRPEACTEGIAALGLCVPQPALIKDAERPATSRVIARPDATDAGNAGKDPSRPEACTAAAAALGLCTPGPTQRSK